MLASSSLDSFCFVVTPRALAMLGEEDTSYACNHMFLLAWILLGFIRLVTFEQPKGHFSGVQSISNCILNIFMNLHFFITFHLAHAYVITPSKATVSRFNERSINNHTVSD